MLPNGRALQMPLSRAWLKAPLLGGVSEGRGGFKYALIQNGTKKSRLHVILAVIEPVEMPAMGVGCMKITYYPSVSARHLPLSGEELLMLPN